MPNESSNFRDIGGVVAADGRVVRSGLIYRSGTHADPDADEAAMLTDAGIVLVCDLRTESERSHAPNSWFGARDVRLLECDLLGAIPLADTPWELLRTDASPAGGRAAMLSLYSAFPAAAGSCLASILRQVAAGNIPLLIHCTAGKDRTGFVAAMMLAALGVSHDAIERQYLESAGRITAAATAASRTMFREKLGTDIDEAAIRVMMGVERDFIAAAFAVVDRDYGGIDGYLRRFGVDDATRTAFAERLLG